MPPRPPRGYRNEEYPLPHNFSQSFSLSAENEALNTAIIQILRTHEGLTAAAETIEVNPRNAAFAEETGSLIGSGSIVPRIEFSLNMRLSKLAIETDKVRALIVNFMPIYMAFLPSLDAEDDKTAVSVEDILEIQHNPTDKDTVALHSTTNLLNATNFPLSTVNAENFADVNLTTDAVQESVAFDYQLWKDAMQYYTNGGMLRKVCGAMRWVHLTRDKTFRLHSFNFTNPTVKRGNPYTYCGVMVHLPQVGSAEQIAFAGDTTAIGHVDVFSSTRYNEWNPFFEQVAL